MDLNVADRKNLSILRPVVLRTKQYIKVKVTFKFKIKVSRIKRLDTENVKEVKENLNTWLD